MPPKKAPTQSAPSQTPADQLASLISTASQHYIQKQYSPAAEAYSRAVELQASINGEMAVENAELLYLYGRALYHVAIGKSDVLGGKVAGEKPKAKAKSKKAGGSKGGAQRAEEAVGKGKENGASSVAAGKPKAGGTAFFQIEGDDVDWDTDDDDEEGEDGEDGGEDVNDDDNPDDQDEDDDDFTISYEILETARVLLSRQILESTGVDPSSITHANDTSPTTTTSSSSKPPAPLTPTFTPVQLSDPATRTQLDRLSDIHDIQSEISLENESFSLAISDARASLALKTLLYPFHSKMVAEMHLKLALALEMAAQTTTEGIEDDQLGRGVGERVGVDEEVMKEAVGHMEMAVESTKERVQQAREAVAGLTGDAKREKEEEIKDVQALLGDLEARLVEMREPPVALHASTAGPAGAAEDAAAQIRGLLGSMLGASPEEQRKKVLEASRNANDLTGMVKRKGKEATGSAATTGAGVKRKADDGEKEQSKKARVEDVDGEDELA